MSKTKDLIIKAAEEYSLEHHNIENAKENEHKRICYNLIRLHNEYKFPISALLYLAIGTSAHKIEELKKGFNKFNSKKAIQVIKYCDLINKRLNHNQLKHVNYRINERIIHAMSRYYDLTHDDGKELKKKLSNDNIVNNLYIKIREKKSSMEIFNLLK